ncbi:MAG TPA: sulfite exporter TauE/SafE family protein [Candidatus Caenarcaniphilales bacterium]
MHPLYGLALAIGGFITGVVTGLSGLGGGILLVPLLVSTGTTPVQAVATSTFAKLMIAASGSWHNWRSGNLDCQRVITLGLPALVMAQLGVYLVPQVSANVLLSAFGGLLLVNLYLIKLRRQLMHQEDIKVVQRQPWIVSVGGAIAGSGAGLLIGLFGVGGGMLLVPLQILLLGETFEIAVCTSLGVVLLTSMSACISHAFSETLLLPEGALIGIAGSVGAQIGARILPKISGMAVSLSTQFISVMLSVYVCWHLLIPINQHLAKNLLPEHTHCPKF